MKNGLIVEMMMISRTVAKTSIFNPDGFFGIHKTRMTGPGFCGYRVTNVTHGLVHLIKAVLHCGD
jgi:hypothetical protein